MPYNEGEVNIYRTLEGQSPMSTAPFSTSIYYLEALPIRRSDNYYRYTDTRYYKTTQGLETKLLRAIGKHNWWRIDVYVSNTLAITLRPHNNQHPPPNACSDWSGLTQLLGSDAVEVKLRAKYG